MANGDGVCSVHMVRHKHTTCRCKIHFGMTIKKFFSLVEYEKKKCVAYNGQEEVILFKFGMAMARRGWPNVCSPVAGKRARTQQPRCNDTFSTGAGNSSSSSSRCMRSTIVPSTFFVVGFKCANSGCWPYNIVYCIILYIMILEYLLLNRFSICIISTSLAQRNQHLQFTRSAKFV